MGIALENSASVKRWGSYFSIAVLFIAALVLTGWQFNVPFLLHPLPKLAVMNPVTAAALGLYSIAFFLIRAKGHRKKSIAKILAILISLVGAARFLDWKFGTAFNIDTLMFPEKISHETAELLYRRMSPLVALCFPMMGLSLLLLNYETKSKRMPSNYFGLAIAFLGFVSFLGYLYNANAFMGSLTHVPMAFHTSICLVLVSLSIFFSNPGKGVMKNLTGQLAGSIMTRRLIPFVFVLPVLFGIVRLYIHFYGIDTNEVWITLGITSVIISLLGIVNYTSTLLNKRDSASKQAEAEVRKLNAELEQKVTERTEEIRQSATRYRLILENNLDAIILLDENFKLIYRSSAALRMTGWTDEDRIKTGIPINQAHPDDVRHVRQVMQDVIANPGKAIPLSVRTIHKDGHYIHMEGIVTNLLHDEGVKAIVSNMRDVTERKESEKQIKQLTSELRELLGHIQTSREEERKFIAREIHDELGQRLTALKMDVAMMQRKNAAGDADQNYLSEEFSSVLGEIDNSIKAVKQIATDLRPEILDHLDIVDAVKWQAQQFKNITGIACKVFHSPIDFKLEPAVCTTVYRTVQEALTNVTRHASATSVNIALELHKGKLLVEIKDDGKGIPDRQLFNKKSFGIIGMRERVHLLKGSLSIASFPGKGTSVVAEIPYAHL